MVAKFTVLFMLPNPWFCVAYIAMVALFGTRQALVVPKASSNNTGHGFVAFSRCHLTIPSSAHQGSFYFNNEKQRTTKLFPT
jgi:hypothetical protein